MRLQLHEHCKINSNRTVNEITNTYSNEPGLEINSCRSPTKNLETNTPKFGSVCWVKKEWPNLYSRRTSPSKIKYPSETDNSSKYKLGAKTNYGAKFVWRWSVCYHVLKTPLTDGKSVLDGWSVSKFVSRRNDSDPGGTLHMKGVGTLVENFELIP